MSESSEHVLPNVDAIDATDADPFDALLNLEDSYADTLGSFNNNPD